jgi:CMP-N-acetylneuraminic acid synthetase
MINKKRILAIVPARSGSKGLKNKNFKILNKKPLFAHPLTALKKSKYIDKCF